jgi:hypothetical protein
VCTNLRINSSSISSTATINSSTAEQQQPQQAPSPPGRMPITNLDCELAACPAVGPECRLCYSDMTTPVSAIAACCFEVC